MRRSRSIKAFSIYALAASFGLTVGCGKKKDDDDSDDEGGNTVANGGGSDSGDDTLVMSGTIALGSSLTDARVPAAIFAVPLYNGAPDSQKVGASVESPIADDGSFAANAANGSGITDAVFVIVDADGEVINTIGMPSNATNNLLNIPVTSEATALDVGLVTPNGENPDATTEKSAKDGAKMLGLSDEKVTQDADTGAVLRTIRNILNNCERSGDGRCIDVQTTHEFGGSVASSINAWSEPSVISYSGYSFIISFMNTSYKFSDVCQAGNPIILTLFPPSTITGTSDQTGSISVTPSEGLSNVGLTVSKTNNGANQCEPASGATSTAYIGESGQRFNFIPFSGAKEYKFDLASASPIDTDGVARAWTPVAKVTADPTTKIISKVEIRFYTYNDEAGWVETTDTAALLSAIGGAGSDDNSGQGGVTLTFDDSSSGTRLSDRNLMELKGGANVFEASNFENEWRLPLGDGVSPSGSAHPTSLRITYTLRGTQLNFNLN